MKIETFTYNSKTILSIDFDRKLTCLNQCPWCYCNTLERIYPAWKEKIYRNFEKAKETPKQFAEQLNAEYAYLRNRKQKKLRRLHKLPVRIYGSGDFIEPHYDFLTLLNFKHYIISKNLTESTYTNMINKLLNDDKNLTSLVLSFYNGNIKNYDSLKSLFGTDRIKFCYTGMADEFNEVLKQGYKFNIFFNISKKKSERDKSKLIKEQCPCDSGLLQHNESCSFCSKCWRSSITKTA